VEFRARHLPRMQPNTFLCSRGQQPCELLSATVVEDLRYHRLLIPTGPVFTIGNFPRCRARIQTKVEVLLLQTCQSGRNSHGVYKRLLTKPTKMKTFMMSSMMEGNLITFEAPQMSNETSLHELAETKW
jgi:hypothetical protein